MPPLTLRNGVALVGERLDATPFRELVITDGVIAGIDEGPASDAATLDLDGAFVLPGLIDAHVHLSLDAAPNRTYDHWRQPAIVRAATLLRNGLLALARGITAVRDLGCVDESVLVYGRRTAAGAFVGPRVVACGRWICATGGHGFEHGRVADGPVQMRTAVREQLRDGAQVIKVMATGGMSTPGDAGRRELTAEEVGAAVDEATAAGPRVAAHAHGADGVLTAVEAGAASIEHGALAGPLEVDAMIRHGVALVPTLMAVRNIEPGRGIEPEIVATVARTRDTYYANVQQAIKAGVTVVAGTDAGTALNPIGQLIDELKLYTTMGLSPGEAIATATVAAGRLLDVPIGILEAGAAADLLVVAGDPRDDLDHLHRPSWVIHRGRLGEPSAMLRAAHALGAGPADYLLNQSCWAATASTDAQFTRSRT